jgi:type II secretory pathway pseudopilin PulG
VTQSRKIAAFTLVELLVVIGIIALLVGLLLPALHRARQAARSIQASAGLREMMLGYTQYHIDNKGALLFGYTPATVNGGNVIATDPNTGATYGMPVADRYPWRLAPYVANMWRILHMSVDDLEIPQPGDPHSPPFVPGTAEYKAYILSLNPTFGINSIFVGGHNSVNWAGFIGDRPNTGKHAVFRQSEVRNPSTQIVFTEVLLATNVGPVPVDGAGYFFSMPPNANGQRWTVTNEKFVVTSGLLTGLPKGRYGLRTLVAFFDGHVEGMLPSQLTDMRLWANRATGPNYDFTP